MTAAMSGALVFSVAPAADAHSPVRASAKAHPSLRYDSSGDAVRALQKRLGVTPSGWFGPMTRAAVLKFQRSHGLRATGVVNAATWRSLTGDRRDATRRSAPNRVSRDANRSSLAERVLRAAGEQKGKPYRYGATGPFSFDCSGFTGYVFRAAGVNLPRTSRQQRAAVRRITSGEARPGDLLFTHDSGGRVYHVAIYAGGGMIWDSSRPGETVSKRRVWSRNITFGRPS